MSEFTQAAAKLAGAAGWVLHWTPEDFWAATPAELAAVLGAAVGDGGAGAVTRVDVANLQERFPDG